MEFLLKVKTKLTTAMFNDSSLHYAMLYRIWGILSGAITILIISIYFPTSIQGYYYTFLSIVALQAFLELGLYVVIMNVASHEWAGLSLNSDRSIGGNTRNLSRLISLGRNVFKWYGIVVLLFVIIVGTMGVLFFPKNELDIWLAPWCTLVLFSGLNLFVLPMISLLEGCGQIREINKFRLTQAFLSSLILWYLMYAGADLWAMVLAAFVVVLRDIYLLCVYYRAFFKPFWTAKISASIDWKNEIWPMQWRLALQAISGYFLLQLITPVVFYYHGSIEAGRIGMAMQIVFSLQALGQVWLLTKAPLFGALIAKEDFSALNRMWKQASLVSVSVVLLLGLSLVVVTLFGHMMELQVMDRIVGPWQLLLLVLAQVFSQILQAEAAYLRAFKKEYFLLVGVVGGVIAGLLIWYLGAGYGINGAIIGYTFSMALVLIWATYIFISRRHSSLFSSFYMR